MSDVTPTRARRPLLTTTTGEALQLVRLYYAIPSKPVVTGILSRLRCMEEHRERRCWAWLYDAEAAELTLGPPRPTLPPGTPPILIGTVRFPKKGSMTIEFRSLERAIAGATFFGPLLGPGVVARRVRIVNHLFDATESPGGLAHLDRRLDQDVTVIDPRVAEQKMERYFAGAKTPAEAERAFERYHEDQRRENRDVPPVEDFPLAPEEETPDFMHLSLTLRLRGLRALEHWEGNTTLTLQDIIYQLSEQGALTPRR